MRGSLLLDMLASLVGQARAMPAKAAPKNARIGSIGRALGSVARDKRAARKRRNVMRARRAGR